MKTTLTAASRLCLSLFTVVLTLFAIFVPTCTHAQLAFTLTPNTLAGRSGDVLTFSGTLTNQGADELFLTGDLFTLSGADLTLDDSPFLTNFPLSLSGGEMANGDMFTVVIGPRAATGTFPGSFTILGGPNAADTNQLTTQSFVVAVPEPDVLALFLCSGVALSLGQRRKRKTRANPMRLT